MESRNRDLEELDHERQVLEDNLDDRSEMIRNWRGESPSWRLWG